MYEPSGDGSAAAAVAMNPRSTNATTSPPRRSPSAVVRASKSPVGLAAVPGAQGLTSACGIPLGQLDGQAAMATGGTAALLDTHVGSVGDVPLASPPASVMHAQQRTSPSGSGIAAALGDPDLDMFDIELQREFQSKMTSSAAAPSCANSACISPPTTGLCGSYLATNNGRWSGHAAANPPMRTAQPYSPWYAANTVGDSGNGKQFASLADMCQTSNFLERRDDVQRLVHRLASAIQTEMHVTMDHGVLVTVMGTGNTAEVMSPAGTPVVVQPSPQATSAVNGGAAVNTTPSVAAVSRSFEQDIRLVNLVVGEVTRRYGNMQPSPSSPRASMAAMPGPTTSTTAASGAAIPIVPRDALNKNSVNGGGSTNNANNNKGQVHSGRLVAAAPSPTGGARGQQASHGHRSALAAQQQQQARREYMSGRSTIDTEVNDSLGRIHASSVLPHHSHFLPSAPSATNSPQSHEPVTRPSNPYPGSHSHARASAAASQNQPHPGMYPSELLKLSLLHSRDGQSVRSAAAAAAGVGGSVKGGSVARAAAVSEHLAAWDTRSNHSTATTARSESGVQCPRAVKPTASSTSTKTSGPRNRTGKNIVPSDRSAFSECSGGETRSSFHSQMNSTFRHNHSSSTCRTADTSLSGAMPVVTVNQPVSGAVNRSMAAAGSASAGIAVVTVKEEVHTAS